MRDIRYKWNEGPNSVGVSSEVSLPQFKVLGHRQRAMEISLTTGTCRRLPHFYKNTNTITKLLLPSYYIILITTIWLLLLSHLQLKLSFQMTISIITNLLLLTTYYLLLLLQIWTPSHYLSKSRQINLETVPRPHCSSIFHSNNI